VILIGGVEHVGSVPSSFQLVVNCEPGKLVLDDGAGPGHLQSSAVDLAAIVGDPPLIAGVAVAVEGANVVVAHCVVTTVLRSNVPLTLVDVPTEAIETLVPGGAVLVPSAALLAISTEVVVRRTAGMAATLGTGPSEALGDGQVGEPVHREDIPVEATCRWSQ
jgi:hypothetical protein